MNPEFRVRVCEPPCTLEFPPLTDVRDGLAPDSSFRSFRLSSHPIAGAGALTRCSGVVPS
jgi:hypothetical protein